MVFENADSINKRRCNKTERRRQQWKASKKKNYEDRKSNQPDPSNATVRKRQSRAKQTKHLKNVERQRYYAQKSRQKLRCTSPIRNPCNVFKNRMAKSRYLHKLKTALPNSPEKRAAVLSAYTDPKRVKYSPAVKHLYSFSSTVDLHETSPENACLHDIGTVLNSLKSKCDSESRASVKLLAAAVNGETVSKLKCATKLAKTLGIKRRLMYGGKRVRTSVVRSEKSVFEYTKRKTRNDCITDNVKKLAFDFWLRPDISRPTNNKNDVKRVRLQTNKYSTHACMILEKTQSEVYQEFKEAYPHVKLGQRSFEKCKPYYLRSASIKDMSTCCCRSHVEIRSVFKTCMSVRKRFQICTDLKQYKNLTELVNDTLCEPSANTHQHKSDCLNRLCKDCGIANLNLYPVEATYNGEEISWERFDYQTVKHKDGSEIRKLMLIKKHTSPKELFEYFEELLIKFPAHEFRAKWQGKQLKNALNNLPIGHCIAVHDYSENYKCIAKEEIQAAYFQKVEVSLHVSVLYRHATLEVDGYESTESNPKVVTEQFFVISTDCRHDHHFTHEVQRQVTDYLHSVTDSFHTLHEFTDGCSSQYKSCHCIGDISQACLDFNLSTVIRNYFETSHGRGPQDAAGGFVKRMADMAVFRGTHIIQNARDLYKFAEGCLENTKNQASCSRRIFRYVEFINRERPGRYFTPVKENRKIHQVISTLDGSLSTRDLSCYSCEACIATEYEKCSNDSSLGQFKRIQMRTLESKTSSSSSNESDLDLSIIEDPVISELVSPGNVIAVRNVDDEFYPYYLLMATSCVVRLRKQYRDKWGAEFQPGHDVIHGNYFQAVANNLFCQSLIKKSKATVPAQSVVYICNEVDVKNGKIHISDSIHRRILKSMS